MVGTNSICSVLIKMHASLVQQGLFKALNV
jgi:hypothetical protein